ncbi:hypothetical protein JCM10450v2_008361 [Rhodotorula kratochvilovae]
MPPLLPPELYRLILQHACPVSFAHYTERQETLRSCCLVSKVFLGVARPFLWEVVSCWTRSIAKRLKREAGKTGNAQYTRALRVDWEERGYGGDDDIVSVGTVLDTIKCFTELRRLNLMADGDAQWIRMAELTELVPGLQQLTAHRCTLSWERSPSFVVLRELHLDDSYDGELDEPLWPTALEASMFPSLRLLRIGESCWGGTWPPIQAQLVDQLDALQLDLTSTGGHNVPASYTSTRTPVLVCAGPRLDLDPRFPHRCIIEVYVDMNNPRGLEAMPAMVTASSSLRSLFLPSTISPSRPLPPPAQRVRDAILAACQQNKIDVRWYPRSDPWPAFWSSVLPEFLEYIHEKERSDAVA